MTDLDEAMRYTGPDGVERIPKGWKDCIDDPTHWINNDKYATEEDRKTVRGLIKRQEEWDKRRAERLKARPKGDEHIMCVEDYGGVIRDNWPDFLTAVRKGSEAGDKEFLLSTMMAIQEARQKNTGVIRLGGEEHIIKGAVPNEIWVHIKNSFCPACGKCTKIRNRKRNLKYVKQSQRCHCVNRDNARKPRKPKLVLIKETGQIIKGEALPLVVRTYRQIPR